ncbi:hypothetical protein H8356DRAFT_1334490 [Neocallimastix lanati (nom. inval.)]|nr:hypothetical protein H8356DRAFT_1334490 [Neocallimastix sp. JGI-2020a]
MITENATLNKCKSFIILNDKKEIFLYNNLEKEFDASVSITKHKIKEKIRKSSIPLDIKPKRIFNAVSQKIEFICPEYKIIKSKLTININKQLPPDNFIIFKNANLIIFQFPFQAKLFMKYILDIFADDTFYIVPKFTNTNIEFNDMTNIMVLDMNEFETPLINMVLIDNCYCEKNENENFTPLAIACEKKNESMENFYNYNKTGTSLTIAYENRNGSIRLFTINYGNDVPFQQAFTTTLTEKNLEDFKNLSLVLMLIFKISNNDSNNNKAHL